MSHCPPFYTNTPAPVWCVKVEAGGFWRELEALLRVGGPSHQPLAPQPLRTWALHALSIVARTLDLGLAQQARVRSMLHGMTALLEAHFLGAWTPPSAALGSVLEPAMLVSLLRLTTAMVPMVQALAPNQALVARFEAVCFGVVDIVPRALQGADQDTDPRVGLEALHTAELLAALRPAQQTNASVAHAIDAAPLFDYQVNLPGQRAANLPY